MPEARIRHRLQSLIVRMRVVSMVWAVAAGAALFAALVVLLAVLRMGATTVVTVAALAAIVLIVSAISRSKARWNASAAAEVLERRDAHLHNLVVTAAELMSNPKPMRAEIRSEILRQADEKLGNISVAEVEPLTRPIGVLTAVLIGCGVVLFGATRSNEPFQTAARVSGDPAIVPSITAIHVRVIPPAYLSRPDVVLENPLHLPVMAGSTIHLAVDSKATNVQVVGAPTEIRLRVSGESFTGSWVAEQSAGLAIRAGGGEGSRFLAIEVTDDHPPTVRVIAPGKDVAAAPNAAPIAIAIESADDIGLRSLSLHYVLGTGGAESLTFTEHEVPIALTRSSERAWTAQARLALSTMGLSAGDAVVYRAVVRDNNPASAPVQSESYIIEIGQPSESAGSGFAVPAEERKYAISQQMVIYKTEQLIATRAQHAADLLDQSRLLAIEQRMVRSEIVFLGGGEIQDEEVEAAASDELTEGRLQNTGRIEMLRAINAMSKAEAELNGANLPQALSFERAALKSLEAAFDRRRYFLKTLTERARIDPARRLTGDVKDARSWIGPRGESSQSDMWPERLAIQNLSRLLDGTGLSEVDVAARVLAVDPSSAELQKAALAIASATDATRVQVIKSAMRVIAARAVPMLGPAAVAVSTPDPLAGRLADQLANTSTGRRP